MSNLREYLESYHGLTLLSSEVDDILSLARMEIDLPTNEEIINESRDGFEDDSGDPFDQVFRKGFRLGATWVINKIKNPYPIEINFTDKPERDITDSLSNIALADHERLGDTFIDWKKLSPKEQWRKIDTILHENGLSVVRK